MPDKLTDSEIVKALECCTEDIPNCDECPYDHYCSIHSQEHNVLKDTLDLINRLQAENERLKTEKDNLIKNYRECQVDNLKKFAERLNHIFWHEEDRVIRKVINNLLKELVGE